MSTLQVMVPLLFVILAGFVSGKLRIFDNVGRKVLAKFVFYVAASALIINAVASINVADFHKFPQFILANAVIATATYTLIFVALRLLRVGYKSGASHLYAGNVANNIFLGFPLISALYGPEGLLYAVVYVAVPMTFMDLVDFYLLSKWRHDGTSMKTILLDFAKNPLVISIAIGAAMLLPGLKPPVAITSGLAYLGTCATGLSLFSMGLFLSFSTWKQFQIRKSLVTSFIKLAIVPAITYCLAKNLFHLQGIPLDVSVIMAALPSAIFCLVVATQYEFDERLTADSIIMSTLLFMATSIFWVAVLR